VRDRRLIGRIAEDCAAEHLRAHGCEIVLRNFRRRRGEIDIVALDGRVLVIAEVRLRAREDYGGAAASVDRCKRRRIVGAAQQLLQSNRTLAAMPVRFDVLVVHERTEAWRVEWLKHAFDAGG
jgi:putative endonuclease